MVTIRTKKQYERALEDLEDLRKARKKILLGGQSYTIGSNQLNRAALKEVNAEIILFGKTVDGVYDSDPKENPNAKKFTEITYTEILQKNLKVMDSTAASLCRDNNMPTMIFALGNGENIISAVSGENIGTIVNN